MRLNLSVCMKEKLHTGGISGTAKLLIFSMFINSLEVVDLLGHLSELRRDLELDHYQSWKTTDFEH